METLHIFTRQRHTVLIYTHMYLFQHILKSRFLLVLGHTARQAQPPGRASDGVHRVRVIQVR